MFAFFAVLISVTLALDIYCGNPSVVSSTCLLISEIYICTLYVTLVLMTQFHFRFKHGYE